MKLATLMLVAFFALGTVSMGVASAKTAKQEKAFFILPIIGKYLLSHPEEWPTSPFQYESPERVFDEWPDTPYKTYTPELRMK